VRHAALRHPHQGNRQPATAGETTGTDHVERVTASPAFRSVATYRATRPSGQPAHIFVLTAFLGPNWADPGANVPAAWCCKAIRRKCFLGHGRMLLRQGRALTPGRPGPYMYAYLALSEWRRHSSAATPNPWAGPHNQPQGDNRYGTHAQPQTLFAGAKFKLICTSAGCLQPESCGVGKSWRCRDCWR